MIRQDVIDIIREWIVEADRLAAEDRANDTYRPANETLTTALENIEAAE